MCCVLKLMRSKEYSCIGTMPVGSRKLWRNAALLYLTYFAADMPAYTARFREHGHRESQACQQRIHQAVLRAACTPKRAIIAQLRLKLPYADEACPPHDGLDMQSAAEVSANCPCARRIVSFVAKQHMQTPCPLAAKLRPERNDDCNGRGEAEAQQGLYGSRLSVRFDWATLRVGCLIKIFWPPEVAR